MATRAAPHTTWPAELAVHVNSTWSQSDLALVHDRACGNPLLVSELLRAGSQDSGRSSEAGE